MTPNSTEAGPQERADARIRWQATAIAQRLSILRRARFALADRVSELTSAISPELVRTAADTLISEVLPLLDACRFLERRAESLLAPRKLGRSGDQKRAAQYLHCCD